MDARMHPGQGEAQQQQSWRLTMKPDSHPEHRQKATTVSWYSSGVACFASTLTATGSTVRAATTATRSPDPNDTATLCIHHRGLSITCSSRGISCHAEGPCMTGSREGWDADQACHC